MKIKSPRHIVLFFTLGLISLHGLCTDKKQSFSAKFGTGTVITNESTLDTKSSGQLGLVYDYQLNENYAISTKYLEGSCACFITCFTNDFRSAEWQSQHLPMPLFDANIYSVFVGYSF